jgi:hypothetical protein
MTKGHQPTGTGEPPRYPIAHKSGAKGPSRLPTLRTPDGLVKSVMEWQEFARRDDCLDRMVPSDLRVILSNLT